MRDYKEIMMEFRPEDYNEFMALTDTEFTSKVYQVVRELCPKRADGTIDTLCVLSSIAVVWGVVVSALATDQESVCDLHEVYSRFSHEVAHAHIEMLSEQGLKSTTGGENPQDAPIIHNTPPRKMH
jgi:hypothetical protein